MILADSTVWIDHLRRGDMKMLALLESDVIAMHPFVIGEVSLGHLKRRKLVLNDMSNLPPVTVASDDEVLRFIETADLIATGLGYVDVHLLASAKLGDVKLWTRDKYLRQKAAELALSYEGV